MKKFFALLTVLTILCAIFCGCGSDNDNSENDDYDYSSSYGSYNKYSSTSSYGFSDYLKDQAPDLYNDIKNRYEGLN